VFSVPWNKLEQRGFGVEFDFDPKELTHVQFEFDARTQIDLRVDHVGFYGPGE
jgi:hypothetical protein